MTFDKGPFNKPPDDNLPPEEKHHSHLHLPESITEPIQELRDEATKLVRKGRTRLQIWLHSALGIAIVLFVLVSGALWYSTTPRFATFVRQRVEQSMAAATGGRVELGSFHWSMWRRTISLNNLTIHGLEKPTDAPYMHVDHIEAQLRWSGFFFSSYVYLESLNIVRPSINLLVDKDGNTNAPHPQHTMSPLTQTLLDLAVSHISVQQGVAHINTQDIPIDFVAANTTLQLRYVPGAPHSISTAVVLPVSPNATSPEEEEKYTADFSSDNVHTRTYDEAVINSQLSGHFTFTKDAFSLDKFSWHTPVTQLNATFNLSDFNHPQWHSTTTGTVDLHQAAAITGIDGFSSGIMHLNLNGHSCALPEPTPAPGHHILPQFPQFNRPHATPKPATPSATCNQLFVVEGELSGDKAAWKNDIVQVETTTTSTRIYATPHEMDFLDMHAALATGATGRGDMYIYNYIGTAPLRGVLDATVANLPLHNVLVSLTPKPYNAIDYNSGATGNVHVSWTDRRTDSDVRGTLQLQPVWGQNGGGQTGVPITGVVQAAYTGSNNIIKIQDLDLTTPQSSLKATGILGVLNGDPLTALHMDLATHDLSEFDTLLHLYSLSSNNKVAHLHGAAEYNGTVTGPLAQLELRGHVSASNVDLFPANIFPDTHQLPATVHLDQIESNVDLSQAGINLQQARLQVGEAALNFSGQLHPVAETHLAGQAHPQPVTTYLWDKNSTLDLDLNAHAFPIASALAAPITGELTGDIHLTGTLAQPLGEGHIDARNGAIALGATTSEPYQQFTAALSASGTTWSLSNAMVTLPAGKITGDFSYDLNSGHATGHLHTADLALNRLRSVPASAGLTGQLSLDASASGTAANPGIQGSLSIKSLALAHQAAGTLTAQLHSAGNNLLYDLHSDAFSGHMQATGQTTLTGQYPTQLKATLSGVDLAPLLQLSRFKLSGHSELGGEVSLSGPLSQPEKLTGSASLSRFHIELSGVALDAAEPLHFSIADNILHLDQVHITGPDTNIHLQGSANFLHSGTVRLHSEGNVNVKLLQTFDPDIVSSGQIAFSLNAAGPITAPDYGGNIRFNHASLALADLPNGLSQITGTLNFNRDRLEVTQLTAMTGGGQISLGGTINLRGGVYADITARGKDNRIRYPLGVSSTADTDLRLQGSPTNALLSGHVLLTRFGINQEFDLANFALANSTVSVPADPNSPSSHLRLDVHITSAPQLDFQNSFAKLAGDVDLELRGTVATPSLLGRINISEGSASFAGTQYQLQSGSIGFSNPVHIEPLINLAAITRVRDYDVFIELHGPLANLHPTYRSEPPLSQTDILALLALGRTQEEAEIYQQQQNQGAGAASTNDTTLLGGALNQTVSNRAQRLFGVGSVKLDPTFVGTLGNSSARVTVEQSLARDVTVTYATNVNETAEQLIQVTWDLTRSISLVSQRDENGVFSMTFKIRQRRR